MDCVRIAKDVQDSILRIALTDITVRKQAEAEQRAVLQMGHLRQLAIEEMLKAEVHGYVVKSARADELVSAIHEGLISS